MLLTFFSRILPEAGCDEAGRGCLAGPVVAAAVIFPKGYKNKRLNDSKQLSAARRDELALEIKNDAIAWATGQCDHSEIDTINILNASILAMHRAVAALHTIPAFLIIDGNRFHPYLGTDGIQIPYKCIIKGDSKYQSIAAASILAKTLRDEIMDRLHNEFPIYGWNKNKGYGTELHRNAFLKHGPSSYHRRTFHLHNKQLTMEL